MRISNGNIYLSTGRFANQNILYYDRVYYRIEALNTDYAKSRGGNSSVFKLINPNDDSEYAIKFSKYAIEDDMDEGIRFEREIEALTTTTKMGCDNIIKLYFDGQKKIGNKTFPFYVMEKADSDLRSLILNNKITLTQKILLCHELIKGIKELHSMEIYHRDIKPDNIFFINRDGKNKLKIGDLGLIIYRNEDLGWLEYQKKVGPVGWLSPEVMNKVLCEGTKFEHINDCIIDTYSDIFQLGKVFWFIFKYCIPIGQVSYVDFEIKNRELFDVIIKMIQHKKNRREDLDYLDDEFMELAS